jgi:hypothetical protein
LYVYGTIVESYGKYVKIKVKDGEFVIRSDKKAPKEGTKIEIKDFGKGDYLAKVLAKKPGEFEELPSVRFIDISEKLLSGVNVKHLDTLSVALALFLEELAKRIDLTHLLMLKLQNILSGDSSEEEGKFLIYLNLLSGRYGLKSEKNTVVFMDRKLKTFLVFLEDNKIFGKVTEGIQDSVILYFEKVPDNAKLLEESLKRYFQVVLIKLESFSEGAYV